MVKVLFTDTHYGVRQNSMTWLKSQMEFLDKDLIPKLKELRAAGETIRLIHCGDVFDSRSSISPYVASKVREKFSELCDVVDEFIIVAGNHDFYSPNSDEVDSLSLVFTDPRIKLVIKELYQLDEDLFIPWYVYKDDDVVATYLATHPEVRNIYTHADIFHEDAHPYDTNIYSGHIHQPHLDGENGRYNLGSCYSIDFTDNNSFRHFYVIKNGVMSSVANTSSIRFWRLYNEDIFNITSSMRSNDYYELYITQENMQSPKYTSQIAELTTRFKNCLVIPQIKVDVNESEQLETYDILEICQQMIPEKLQDKFHMVEESLQLNKHE